MKLTFLWLMILLVACAVQAQKPGDVIVNSIGMDLVYIPAGSFEMGSPYDEKGHQQEEPLRKVTLTKAFRISATEVTQAQWEAVMERNRSQFKGEHHPVEKVSWRDAVAFCEKLSEKENHIYRLPTEAEWEYACTAGKECAFSGCQPADSVAWHAKNSGDKTHPVARKQPNAWGLFDMSGNVAEWCADFYQSEVPIEPQTDPAGPEEGVRRVIRGGGYDTFPIGCRCAARHSARATHKFTDTGFRVVMEIE